MSRSFWVTTALAIVSVLTAALLAEGILRIKTRSMHDYEIEMWRYAKLLKRRSADPILGHEHVRSSQAVLQSVLIRLNERGMRGPEIPPPQKGKRRILLLGSSIALGWGVKEEDTTARLLERMLAANGHSVEVLNAGVGNYNTVRYVHFFLSQLKDLDPTDIVVLYFIRDAEVIPSGSGGFLLRESELVALLWSMVVHHLASAAESLEEHYAKAYEDSAPGFLAMKDALKELSDYAAQRKIRLYLAMAPEVHDLKHYPFGYAHRILEQIARQDGYRYIDLLPGFTNLSPEDVWAMPGDPHMNALGNRIMAEELLPVLEER